MFRVLARKGAQSLRVRQLPSVSKRCASEGDFMVDEGDNQPARFERSVNQVNLMGRVGQDAELKGSEAHPVVVFSLATNTVLPKSGGGVTSYTDWHRVCVFKPGLREKVAANLKKGDRVFVNGAIRYNEYRDNEDNVVRSTNIIAADLVNVTKRYLSDEEESSVVDL